MQGKSISLSKQITIKLYYRLRHIRNTPIASSVLFAMPDQLDIFKRRSSARSPKQHCRPFLILHHESAFVFLTTSNQRSLWCINHRELHWTAQTSTLCPLCSVPLGIECLLSRSTAFLIGNIKAAAHFPMGQLPVTVLRDWPTPSTSFLSLIINGPGHALFVFSCTAHLLLYEKVHGPAMYHYMRRQIVWKMTGQTEDPPDYSFLSSVLAASPRCKHSSSRGNGFS